MPEKLATPTESVFHHNVWT